MNLEMEVSDKEVPVLVIPASVKKYKVKVLSDNVPPVNGTSVMILWLK